MPHQGRREEPRLDGDPLRQGQGGPSRLLHTAATSAVAPRSDESDETESSSGEDQGTDSKLPSNLDRSNHDVSRRRAKKIIDWRTELCDLLDQRRDTPDKVLIDVLFETFNKFKAAERLRLNRVALTETNSPRYQLINRINCVYDDSESQAFLDAPTVVEYGPHSAHVRSSRPVNNMELYLERNSEVTFLVYRDYKCCGHDAPDSTLLHDKESHEMNSKALLVGEYISIVSRELRMTLQDLAEDALDQLPHPIFLDENERIQGPYTWWYHRRSEIESVISAMNDHAKSHISVFQQYLIDSYGAEWNAVDALLAQRRITLSCLVYLFVPNEIIITRAQNRGLTDMQGFLNLGWAQVARSGTQGGKVTVHASYWDFHGTFEKRERSLEFKTLFPEGEHIAISDLPYLPIKFASTDLADALRERGRMFWQCRHRNYVSFRGENGDELRDMYKTRFMVDMSTYNYMHPPAPEQYNIRRACPKLEAELMSKEDPALGDEFFMCLPTSIFGFNMQKKEWVTLAVSHLENVKWNNDAFKHLVIEPEAKELVRALVETRIGVEEQTDLILGKGTGLFILLHGGPGTGKTLTAESVAEVAKKPLYRVTCGDIGTKAEEVEKYLETVLTLAKEWGCVVLLDEADVFLEKRALHQLERNALVSVFLRVLEYYEGILILTSNRVGTFDEAFKSRIQLSLRYQNLDIQQRRQIWTNFIDHLEVIVKPNQSRNHAEGPSPRNDGLGIDIPGIRKQVDILAESRLNGREIRNAISTARQLAMFRRQPMSYQHLERAISEADKFDKYVLDLNKGISADDRARAKIDR